MGKDIAPDQPVWQGLIGSLKATSPYQKVATWNWATAPLDDEHINGDFTFFPNGQCAGTSAGAADGYPNSGTVFVGGAAAGNLALGGNEPDQVAYCQRYSTPDTPLEACDSYEMRSAGCPSCTCLNWTPQQRCQYDVTGCGMWSVKSDGDQCAKGADGPFPFQCFGKNASICTSGAAPGCCEQQCKDAATLNFQKFYTQMSNQGYEYATTPLVANDLEFSRDLLSSAKCDDPTIMKLGGIERLRKGCPTHSAFHFYSLGCPKGPEAIQGFKDKVQQAKQLNSDFALAGTVVNELGSLTNGETAPCQPEAIAGMMSDLFSYLQTDGKDVVSQMVWFNQDQTGGTFDLRLVGGTPAAPELTPLGTQYEQSCKEWAKDNGVGL